MQIEGMQKELLDILAAGEPYVLVEAPAGTGKTFCCIQAAKCLWDNKMLLPFQKTLILTFSRNARAQLLKELSKITPEDPVHKHIEINNYHSFFKKYLDAYRDIIGIRQPLVITDDDDYIKLLYAYAEENNISLRSGFACDVIDDFFYDKGVLVSQNAEGKHNKKKVKDIVKFLETAIQFTQNTGCVSFAQFGGLVCRLLAQSAKMAQAISHDYPVLILDEYQDTNCYQETFVRSVLLYSKGIFFADKWQMVYGFRGSTEERLKSLPTFYPTIKKLTFTEYYRYKDKPDLVYILNAIRTNSNFDYSRLVNGAFISCNIPCNNNWQNIKGASQKSQCTIFCSNIFYSTIRIIFPLLRMKKSVAILCRRGIVVNKLVEVFFDHNLHPRTVSDTPEMLRINKLMKVCLEPVALKCKIPALLCIAALCIMNKKIDGEGIDTLETLNAVTLSRKRKPALKLIWQVISPYLESASIIDCWTVLEQMLDILNTVDALVINYPRKRYVEHCIRANDLSPALIDSIMMQRQYIDSFTDISPGLYITTVHQSKGKEFDCVFVVDVDDFMTDVNLLYVSHSRMKEGLYPIKIIYTGVNYGQ